VLVGIGAVLAGLMVCDFILTAAYSSAPGQVSSIKDLWKVGPGPSHGFASVVIPLAIASVVSTALLGGRHHRLAWLPMVIAVAVGLILALYFVTTFQTPAPDVGG